MSTNYTVEGAEETVRGFSNHELILDSSSNANNTVERIHVSKGGHAELSPVLLSIDKVIRSAYL